MLKKIGAVGVPPLYILLAFLLLFITGSVSVNAEIAPADEKSDAKNYRTQPLLRNYLDTPETESDYPLFRMHAERYYPALDLEKRRDCQLLCPDWDKLTPAIIQKRRFSLLPS